HPLAVCPPPPPPPPARARAALPPVPVPGPPTAREPNATRPIEGRRRASGSQPSASRVHRCTRSGRQGIRRRNDVRLDPRPTDTGVARDRRARGRARELDPGMAGPRPRNDLAGCRWLLAERRKVGVTAAARRAAARGAVAG